MIETKSVDGNYGVTKGVGEINEPRFGGVVQVLGGSSESCG